MDPDSKRLTSDEIHIVSCISTCIYAYFLWFIDVTIAIMSSDLGFPSSRHELTTNQRLYNRKFINRKYDVFSHEFF